MSVMQHMGKRQAARQILLRPERQMRSRNIYAGNSRTSLVALGLDMKR